MWSNALNNSNDHSTQSALLKESTNSAFISSSTQASSPTNLKDGGINYDAVFEKTFNFKPTYKQERWGQNSHRDSYYKRAPFSVFSSQVGVNFKGKNVECMFPAKWALITLPDNGHYKITLTSTLKSHFYGANTYMKENALVSQFRACYSFNKGVKDYRRDFKTDSFSVSGVWF